MTALVRYDAACRALAEAKSVDEAKDIRDKAEAMRAYARQAKNRTLEIDAAEIRIRAERRVGELIAQQRETVGLNRGAAAERGSDLDPRPTLAEVGIGKHLADRARKLAAVPDDEFDGHLSEWRARIEAENERVTTNLISAGEKHVRGTLGTGDNEWFTPPEHIARAVEVLGTIDLDPASDDRAQSVVKATAFYTQADDGLTKDWRGTVWMNPPYAQPAISQFIDKLLAEIDAGNVTEAIALTHNYTDTAWFQKAARAARMICFTRGRIRFVAPDGSLAAPTQGQAFFYFGSRPQVFANVFADVGFVVAVHRVHQMAAAA